MTSTTELILLFLCDIIKEDDDSVDDIDEFHKTPSEIVNL